MKQKEICRRLRLLVVRRYCHNNYTSNHVVIGAKCEKSAERVEYDAVYFSFDAPLIPKIYIGNNIGYLLCNYLLCNFVLKPYV